MINEPDIIGVFVRELRGLLCAECQRDVDALYQVWKNRELDASRRIEAGAREEEKRREEIERRDDG